MEDAGVESLILEEIRNREYVGTTEEKDSTIVKDLKALDTTMLERYREAMSGGEKLRYKFLIDVVAGECRCGGRGQQGHIVPPTGQQEPGGVRDEQVHRIAGGAGPVHAGDVRRFASLGTGIRWLAGVK